MATKEQCDFFKDQFVDEEKRYSDLTKRAEIYLSILSLVLTGIIFKLKDISDLYSDIGGTLKSLSLGILIASLIIFSIAFYFLINSLRIKSYQAVMDYKKFRDDLGEKPPENEDFFDDRIVDYMFAVERNETVNDQRANDLTISLRFISGGFVLLIIFVILTLVQKI